MYIVGILLAAGGGKRFGGDKLSVLLADDTPLGVVSCRHLLAAVDKVVSVVRPDDQKLEACLRACGAQVVQCDEGSKGMGHSLACAIHAASTARAWLIALGDMPWIEPQTYSMVADAVRHGAAIAVPRYRDRNGHPVGFSARYFAELSSLSGEQGAHKLIEQEMAQVTWLDCDDQGILLDIDTPTDLSRGRFC